MICYTQTMWCGLRLLILMFACVLLGTPVMAQSFGSGGQIRPYAKESCEKLRAALEKAVPITGSFATSEEWFREESLGIKGVWCVISADGPARVRPKETPSDIAPDMAIVLGAVKKTLEASGFKGGNQLDRFKRDDTPGHRAFGLRDERTTCWVNIYEEGLPGSAKTTPKLLFYRLAIGCYDG